MPDVPRFNLIQAQRLPSEVEELGRRINDLPDVHRKCLAPIYDRVIEGFRLRTRILNVAKEALERIRLDVVCMQFDLEVTRKEKDSLQKKIDDD